MEPMLASAACEHRTTTSRNDSDGARKIGADRIYKQYCDRGDMLGWAHTYDARLCVEHFGTAFFAVSGRFNSVT